MRALLDVNVLVALLDQNHESHAVARQWFTAQAAIGWASCPLTQNGCLRVMSLPGYPNPRPIAEVAARLRDMTEHPVHEFWPDTVSVLDPGRVLVNRVHGSRQLSDVYLLALAVTNGGRLVTLDHRLGWSAVVGATDAHLVRL
jgi:toxin-antitoxin system PIN domain toxin